MVLLVAALLGFEACRLMFFNVLNTFKGLSTNLKLLWLFNDSEEEEGFRSFLARVAANRLLRPGRDFGRETDLNLEPLLVMNEEEPEEEADSDDDDDVDDKEEHAVNDNDDDDDDDHIVDDNDDDGDDDDHIVDDNDDDDDDEHTVDDKDDDNDDDDEHMVDGKDDNDDDDGGNGGDDGDDDDDGGDDDDDDDDGDDDDDDDDDDEEEDGGNGVGDGDGEVKCRPFMCSFTLNAASKLFTADFRPLLALLPLDMLLLLQWPLFFLFSLPLLQLWQSGTAFCSFCINEEAEAEAEEDAEEDVDSEDAEEDAEETLVWFNSCGDGGGCPKLALLNSSLVHTFFIKLGIN